MGRRSRATCIWEEGHELGRPTSEDGVILPKTKHRRSPTLPGILGSPICPGPQPWRLPLSQELEFLLNSHLHLVSFNDPAGKASRLLGESPIPPPSDQRLDASKCSDTTGIGGLNYRKLIAPILCRDSRVFFLL